MNWNSSNSVIVRYVRGSRPKKPTAVLEWPVGVRNTTDMREVLGVCFKHGSDFFNAGVGVPINLYIGDRA